MSRLRANWFGVFVVAAVAVVGWTAFTPVVVDAKVFSCANDPCTAQSDCGDKCWCGQNANDRRCYTNEMCDDISCIHPQGGAANCDFAHGDCHCNGTTDKCVFDGGDGDPLPI